MINTLAIPFPQKKMPWSKNNCADRFPGFLEWDNRRFVIGSDQVTFWAVGVFYNKLELFFYLRWWLQCSLEEKRCPWKPPKMPFKSASVTLSTAFASRGQKSVMVHEVMWGIYWAWMGSHWHNCQAFQILSSITSRIIKFTLEKDTTKACHELLQIKHVYADNAIIC